MNTLEFDSIEKYFLTRRILSGIYIRCDTGQVVTLLGRNGTGKSTLMKIVFGTLVAEFESVRINGTVLSSARQKMKSIGYLPQQRMIPGHLTVRQALRDFRIPADLLLTHFPEFTTWLDARCEHLSGGWHRLLEIVLILHSPKLFVLLDEPFSGLTPTQIDRVKELIVAETSKGIIITDHLFRHTLEIASRIYLLKDGCSCTINSPEELITKGYTNWVDG